MRAVASLLAGACAAAISVPLQAQDATAPEPETENPTIVVTAQRRAESLQTVPIAVSAFDARRLKRSRSKTPATSS